MLLLSSTWPLAMLPPCPEEFRLGLNSLRNMSSALLMVRRSPDWWRCFCKGPEHGVGVVHRQALAQAFTVHAG